MKLAFCIPKYFPYGGLQLNFLRIAQLCQQQGHEIVVYTLIWEGAVPKGFRAQVIPVRAIRNHARNVEFTRRIQPLLAKEKFDGVIGFMKIPGLDIYYAADPCFQARARRQKNWFYRLDARYRTFVALEQAVFRPEAATEILILTQAEIPNYVGCYHTPLKRFHLLPPGIPRDRMAPENAHEIRIAFRRTFAVGDGEHLLLTMGSAFRTKGLDRTVRALASLPTGLREKTRLMVLGDSDAEPFKRLARRLGVADRVQFLGGRADVPRFLLGADLLVHPAYSENTGNVLLEAIVSGLPVLTTANCGYAFYVEEARAGAVLPQPFSQKTLNNNLQEMLISSQRTTWSRNGIAYGRTQDLYSRPETATAIILNLLNGRAG